MWILGVAFAALFLGLAPIPERQARLLLIPVIVVILGWQILKHSLL